MNQNARRFVPIARRRGSRGFAAIVTGLAGFVVLAVGLFVLPASGVDQVVGQWLTLVAVAFGVAHVIAVVGLLRTRRWGAHLVGYLAAIGIGVAAFGILATITGLDPFSATSPLPSTAARAQGVGLLVWMIGLWLVAARYAFRGFPAQPEALVGRSAVLGATV